ncbi:MAG: alkaline phosphatase family protein [Acidobacteriota bacterium]
MKRAISACVVGAFLSMAAPPTIATIQQARPGRPNIVLFVPDGLRSLSVDAESAPTLAALRAAGVDFRNPHSLYPTFTTPNASAMATGHYFGDTGDFGNTIFVSRPVEASSGSVTPFLENDAVLGEVDRLFDADFLNGPTILDLARRAGYQTAVVGKLGPTLIFDHTQRFGTTTIVVDDATGTATGIPLSEEMKRRLTAAGLPLQTPPRGDNGDQGTSTRPGAHTANIDQQNYLAAVATDVVLPMFKESGAPFLLVYWSRDPDGSQHNLGDSLNQFTPGINGPTARAGIRNMDDNLSRIRKALEALGLGDRTNLIVSADHGFSTSSKESETSPSAKATYTDVPQGKMPPGFLAIDIAQALRLPLFDPDNKNAIVAPGEFPKRGNGLVGNTPSSPRVVVAANGGTDLIYLPEPSPEIAGRVVDFLVTQDYVSAIFVAPGLGDPPGTLPMSAVNLIGSARTPTPSIVVGFRSFSTGCAQPLLCAVEVSDSTLQQGQGMHGSLSRADTMNFLAAIGPDFRRNFVSRIPSSNADVGQTIAHLIGGPFVRPGRLTGRVLSEALRGGVVPTYRRATLRAPRANGAIRTVLEYQQVGSRRYFDAGGTPGRTVGLSESAKTE